MSDDSQPHIYNMPAGQPFLQLLADMLLHNPTLSGAFSETHALADFTILLPNRRAVRMLQEVLLAQSGGKPLLMPHIHPLGDIDEEDLLFAQPDDIYFAAENFASKQVISPFAREVELLRLVMAWSKQTSRPASTAQAAVLTADLARFLSQAQKEEIDFAKLAELVPSQFSDNWQQTLAFLTIITASWPRFKQDNKLVDHAEWRAQMLDLQNQNWAKNPPTKPIIAAGSTGSMPAVARLLKRIAHLPQGAIILPGLDTELADDSWTQLEHEHTHPQAGFFHLLASLHIQRETIRLWPGVKITPTDTARRKFINLALLPTEQTGDWVRQPKDEMDVAAAVENLRLVEAPDTHSEAGVIALAMRETLETPEARAILVTPDRALARRVAAELRRWHIEIDDTAGTPLARRPIGHFLRLILEVMASDFAPVAFMALLKHPLTCLSMPRVACLHIIRQLERSVLRGPRPDTSPNGGLASIRAQLDQNKTAKHKRNQPQKESEVKDMFALLEKIAQAFNPLMALGKSAPLCDLAEALMQTTCLLSQQEDEVIGAWQGVDGELGYRFLTELAEMDIPSIACADWPALFEYWLAQCPVRDRHGQHPRLAIMGLFEARLVHVVHADLMILGGLNEGTWPPLSDTGPWVSRPMRETLGLMSPERRQGLAAHDFVQAACAPHVLMTRAIKDGGTPKLAARWLTRMDALMKGLADGAAGAGALAELPRDQRLLALWQTIDRVEDVTPASRPAPRPPIEARPSELPVTQIQHLQSNPYAIYARYVLRLRPLDPLDADISAALRGSFIHKVLELFCRKWPEALPDNVPAELQKLAQELVKTEAGYRDILKFWGPRFTALSAWLETFEKPRREITQGSDAGANIKIYAEVEGKLELKIADRAFILSAKADRIEVQTNQSGDKQITLLDYKTGKPPSARDIQTHKAPQVPLAGAIALAGGFDGIGQGRLVELGHVKLDGGEPPGKLEPIKEPEQIAREAQQGLVRLLEAFARPNMPYQPYTRPKQVGFATDYDHLARVAEWSSVEGEDE